MVKKFISLVQEDKSTEDLNENVKLDKRTWLAKDVQKTLGWGGPSLRKTDITPLHIIGDNVITKDGKIGEVTRLKANGIEKSVIIKVDNNLYAYFGEDLKRCQKKQNYSNKIAYFFDGPISMWGYNLTNHHNVSDKMKNILSTKYNFNETFTVRNSPTTYLNDFINSK